MLRRVSLLLLLSAFASCAYLGSYRTGGRAYDAFLDKELRQERLFVNGEQRLSIKAIPGTEELRKLQAGVAPGYEFKYKPELKQVIVAVSSQNRIPFSSDELKFLLADRPSVGVEELTATFLIQTLYPFAYPYYRVFVVDFEGFATDEARFSVLSSRGDLHVKVRFSDAP
jgi:hypothetical protein